MMIQNKRADLAINVANKYCKNLDNIKFIGITGTNGKSTTAIILKNILSDFGYKVGLIGTGKIIFENEILSDENYSMTTPAPEVLYSAIGKMEEMGAEIIVMEVSSHALDQERVFPINFHIGIFTNLSPEHLDYHKNIDNYFKAKCKLFQKCMHKIINVDDPYGKTLFKNIENADACSIVEYAENKAKNIKDLGFWGLYFEYCSAKNAFEINSKLSGKYNIYNTMLAIRASEILGVSGEKIKESVEKISSIDGRFNVINAKIKIIIDYAHTSSAFSNLLKNLYSYKNTGQNLIVVFGCGGERDKTKRSIMGEISEKYADKVIITSDNPRNENPESIIEDIAKGMKCTPTKVIDREMAIREAIAYAKPGDNVCIVGKGPEKYTIKNGVYTHFDEREIVTSALRERGLCE